MEALRCRLAINHATRMCQRVEATPQINYYPTPPSLQSTLAQLRPMKWLAIRELRSRQLLIIFFALTIKQNMGYCDLNICNSANLTIDADPDVAGIGVRVSMLRAF